AERRAAGQAMAALEHGVAALILAAAAGVGLDDGEERAFLAVAEHREQRHAVALVDRVVAPFAAHHLAAVKGEKLVELGPAEEDAPVLAAIVVEAEDPCHR